MPLLSPFMILFCIMFCTSGFLLYSLAVLQSEKALYTVPSSTALCKKKNQTCCFNCFDKEIKLLPVISVTFLLCPCVKVSAHFRYSRKVMKRHILLYKVIHVELFIDSRGQQRGMVQEPAPGRKAG